MVLALGGLLIGVMKAGFGGGVGVVVTPLLALGTLLGILLNRRLSVLWFNRAILVLVLVVGIRLMVS